MMRHALAAFGGALAGLALLCLVALSAAAQDQVDVAAWESLAARAETALENDRASDRALGQLRSEIAVFREAFLTAQGTNQTRIDTLKAQIAALGPPPEEGAAAESEEIATRRRELDAQLARLQAPRLAAEEAYNRADGLIREIDRTIRERQTAEVRRLGPSPLNPALWRPALSNLGQSIVLLRDEITAGLNRAGGASLTREDTAMVILFVTIALALLLRGRTWMEWLTLRLYAGRGVGHGSPVFAFVVSLGQVIVPVLGMLALREAMYASGLLGLRAQIMAEMLPILGLLFFGAMWLGARVFPRRDAIATPLPLPGGRRRLGRYVFGFFGLLLCAEYLLVRLAAFDRYSEATVTVLTFPILAATGLLLLRLGQMVANFASPQSAESSSYYDRLVRLAGRVLIVLGIASPILGAVGYMAAAKLLVFPMVLSVALLGLLAVLRIVARDFHALFTGTTEDEAAQALTPVLVTFALAVVSLPLFALIWGARLTDLSELWTRFREGFAVGDTRISPSDFITFVIVFAIGYALTRLLQGTLKLTVLPKTRIDIGGRTAIVAGIGYVGIFLAGLFAITAAGIDLSSLAIVAGALSVGIGFGLQNIVSNFVSGIILLVERPISEGDWIEVGGQMGYVRDISVRSTRIETFDRADVIVPNADFVSGVVTNWTRGNLIGRVIVPVGVAYGSDTRLVESILREIAEAHPLVVVNPPPAVLFIDFGADSMNFEIRAILRDVNFVMSVRSDMNHEIAARFAAGGIAIPFAQRDIWLRNPEALAAAAKSGAEPDPQTQAVDVT